MFIGAGPSQIGRDTETDSAALQIIHEFLANDKEVFYASDDANSVMAQFDAAIHFIPVHLTVNKLIDIIREHEIDTIVPVVGNVLALQLCEQLNKTNVLKDLNVRIIGVTTTTIHNINNPELLNKVLRHIKEPTIPTTVVENEVGAVDFAKHVGFPVLLKPIASLSKTNRIKSDNIHQLVDQIHNGLMVSSTNQMAVEKSVVGYKEIEMTVIRDAEGSKLLINGAENFNPVGVHSGDSIIISPIQTLTDTEYQNLRTSALKIAEVLKIKGVCHIQFALDPMSGDYFVTRVNPFFDRTTSFAARCTGYPIAKVVSKILLGQLLRDIQVSKYQENEGLALIEPTLDHIAIRFPTWSFASFKNANQELNTKMKSTGAVMAIGRSVEEALQKAIRSVDSTTTAEQAALDESELSEAQLINVLIHARAGEVYYLLEALRRGYTIDELAEMTNIDAFYFYKLNHLIKVEKDLREHPFSPEALQHGKYFGFGDTQIANLWETTPDKVRDFRLHEANLHATYKGVEPTAGEFPYLINTYYSTFEDEDENQVQKAPKVLILGTANSQVGTNSAAEFTTFETIRQCKKMGYQVVLINNNPNALTFVPELTDKIYLEPLTVENCLNIIYQEKPDKVIAQGKWEIVNQLVARDVPVIQLPLSRTTRSENINADYMAIVCRVNGKYHYFGSVGIDNDKLYSLVDLPENRQAAMERVLKAEYPNLKGNGLYSILLKQYPGNTFKVLSSVPMAIQDLPFLSYIFKQNFAGIITEIMVKGTASFQPEEAIQQVIKYEHVYPYAQFGLTQPQNPPYSLAIGTKFIE